LLHQGKVTRFREGLPKGGVTQFHVDRDGGLWASTTQGLAHFDGKAFHPVGAEMGLPTGTSVTAALDGTGNLPLMQQHGTARELADPHVAVRHGLQCVDVCR